MILIDLYLRIGSAICRKLASRSCSIVLNFVPNESSGRAEALATELRSSYKVKSIQVQADMASETGPQHIINIAKDASSPTTPTTSSNTFQIDIIINNSGTGANFSIEECTPDNFARMYNLNTRGPLLLMKAALPYLPHDRSGRVVNVSSVASTLSSMTRTWARELAERATVNAINLGLVATELWDLASPELKTAASVAYKLTPLAAVRGDLDSADVLREAAAQGGGWPAYVHEIAALVALLCSTDSAWSTGSVLCANGGMKFTS
ncbi:hypothetical protein BDW59DRAFT_178219 [Aspergillus cavernicola]|uniref:NAD(P)-binding protein n=1 Tax=Aspergillus cavernicola TaxID=176166 RepID=A0ABR4HFD9_9EURO